MSLRKVTGYAIIEDERMVPSSRYSARLQLDDSSRFFMYSLDPKTAEALKCTDSDRPRDVFYLLRELSKNNMNPFGAIKEVRIRTGYDGSGCRMKKVFDSVDRQEHGRVMETIFCPREDFKDRSESFAVLENGYKIPLKNPVEGIYIGAIYGCDVYIDGKPLRNFLLGESICDFFFGQWSMALDIEDANKIPLVQGFDSSQEYFLEYYNPETRTHPVDTCEIPKGARLQADEFLRRAVHTNGCELIEIDINDINEDGYYVAEAVTNVERLFMVPSDAFLISSVAGKDAFVEGELVKRQNYQ